MRLTDVLCKQSMQRLLKDIWRRRHVYREPKCIVPPPIVEKGVEIVDANEEFNIKEKIREKKERGELHWSPPVNDPRFCEPPPLTEHQDYHEQPILEYKANYRLMEGFTQALVLTKTQVFDGLSPDVNMLVGAVNIPNQDELAQRYIMQAHVWDPTKAKLPKRIYTELKHWLFKAETGIPPLRIMGITTSNFLRMFTMLGGRHPDLLATRTILHDHQTTLQYSFRDEQRDIQITNNIPYVVFSSRAVPSLADEDAIEKSKTHQLPDMFPIAPTIDLQKQHVYKPGLNDTGFLTQYSHSHPHTIWMNHYDQRETRERHVDHTWSTEERKGRALLTAFGVCAAHAKHLYGADVGVLPLPVSVHCVDVTDTGVFHLLSFQLNTLDMTNDQGIKNLAWFDSDQVMFEKILPKRAMLRNTKYQNYDPAVLKKLMAMYVHGSKLNL